MAHGDEQSRLRRAREEVFWFLPYALLAGLVGAGMALGYFAFDQALRTGSASAAPPIWPHAAGGTLAALLWYLWMRDRMLRHYGCSGDIIGVGALAGMVTCPAGQLVKIIITEPMGSGGVPLLIAVAFAMIWGLLTGLGGGMLWCGVAGDQARRDRKRRSATRASTTVSQKGTE